MAEQLTPDQELAVHNRGGKLLVSAAAGSGKTKVLVDRLLDYLTDEKDPANLDEFLIITYTKAAALELRSKIASKLAQRIAQQPEDAHLQRQLQRLFLTQISTVHSFCTAILQEYAYRVNLPGDFRVAEETECAEIRAALMKDLLERAYDDDTLENHFLEFLDSQGVGRNDGAVPEIVEQVYNAARCHLNPQQWLEDCLHHVELEGITDAADTIWGRYLMEDLFSWLDVQISALSVCLERLRRDSGVEKPIAIIASIVEQLKLLRSSTTWDQVHVRKDINFGNLRFSGKAYDPELAEQVKVIKKACKDGLESRTVCFSSDSRQVLSELRASSGAAQGIVWLVRQFDADFTRVKRSRHILDFSDLEHSTLDLLLGKNRMGPTAAAREIGARFREIMVDEYQDSNGVQDAIFSALTLQKQNCFLVGDVKQSIYRFRLADPQIFLDKYRAYAPAREVEPGAGRKIMLSHNFRSGIEVISGINDVFRTCMSPRVGGLVYGEAEALREGKPHVPLNDTATELYVLEIADGASYAKEAAFAAERIRQMLAQGTRVRDGDTLRPVTPEDIVILLRSPNTMGGAFRDALEAVGLRCAMDGGTGLLDTQEVSTLRALLQTVSNPRQDIPLLSALASPVFGFTADDLADFRGAWKGGSLYDALRRSTDEKVMNFLTVLEELRSQARLEPLTKLLQSCFQRTRLDSIFGAMPGGQARRENLQSFYQIAVEYEQGGLRTLGQFLEYLESLKDKRAASGSNAGCVTLMSIHKSKGLEFPVVFLCGLSHSFNGEDQKKTVLCDKDLGLGLAVADNVNRVRYSTISKAAIAASVKGENISEELRVLYVAMTRAKDRLVMTCTMKNPQTNLTKLARRLIPGGEQAVCMEASCPGDWILATAMQRVEAGELHNAACRPERLHTDDYPWKIRLVQPQAAVTQSEAPEQEAQPFPEDTLPRLRAGLAFRYGHIPATLAPSKQTATGRKGGVREEEAQQDTPRKPELRAWRKPAFREAQRRGTAYGSAVHSVMQFIRYDACADEDSVRREIDRLQQNGLLTPEQAEMILPGQIAAFFRTPIGRKLWGGVPYIREFKFSILDSGEKYGEGLEGEQVLLQGVVDCALLEEDGITILDFKTDHIRQEAMEDAAARYRPQLETYAEALSRIYEKPVKQRLLYFFHLGQLAEV